MQLQAIAKNIMRNACEMHAKSFNFGQMGAPRQLLHCLEACASRVAAAEDFKRSGALGPAPEVARQAKLAVEIQEMEAV